MNEISLTDVIVLGATVACILLLAVNFFYPFIDNFFEKHFSETTRSNVCDEDIAEENDPTVIHAFLNEPTRQQREELGQYLARQSRRQAAEESGLLTRFR